MPIKLKKLNLHNHVSTQINLKLINGEIDLIQNEPIRV